MNISFTDIDKTCDIRIKIFLLVSSVFITQKNLRTHE